jgi:acetoin utilization deacetylase AcuC-like enzyme
VQGGEPHVDNERRLARLRRLIADVPVERALVHREPRAATEAELCRVHTSEHVARIGDGADDAGDGLSPLPPGAFAQAALGAGAGLVGVEEVLAGRVDNAFALVRRAGHHALPERGGGFCVFNNVAVAARAAQQEHGLERVAIVDLDVHHGNGTEAVFAADPGVLTISLHQERLYPPDTGGVEDVGIGTAAGTNVNVPLPGGTGNGGYEHALERVVEPCLRGFEPELVLVACGLDASAYDPMGRMALTARGYGALTRRLQAVADGVCSGRVVVITEGGYSPAYAPFCGLAVVEALADAAPTVDPFEPFVGGAVAADLTAAQADAVEAARQAWLAAVGSTTAAEVA